jgi:hypothetical protein
MPQKTVTVTIHREGSMCFIPVNFDPKTVFGKRRQLRSAAVFVSARAP